MFSELWHKTREKKGSVIIAGVDPAPAGMRDKNALPEGVNMRDWCLKYIEAVAPYVAGIKCNPAYYQYPDGLALMEEITALGKAHGLVTLADYKISDIGSTNDSWLFYTKKMGFDGVTAAPYAGNVEQVIEQAHNHELGVFTMALMSNPEYISEMVFSYEDHALYESRIMRSLEASTDGIVVGATFEPKNPHLQKTLELTKQTSTLFLVPGIGAQGGTIANVLESGVDVSRCLLNIGRSLMFPNGPQSTPAEQAVAAKQFQSECTITQPSSF
jgi:orotidine-5'-phosphate decarboxylase